MQILSRNIITHIVPSHIVMRITQALTACLPTQHNGIKQPRALQIFMKGRVTKTLPPSRTLEIEWNEGQVKGKSDKRQGDPGILNSYLL
jgi:hypothetical protein